MRIENRIVDNRRFLLGLDGLYREAMMCHERKELLCCAREVAGVLHVEPADVPVEGYYAEEDALSEYFRLMRALQNVPAAERPKVESDAAFKRLLEVTSSPLYGPPAPTPSLFPAGRDPLSEALEATFPRWTVANLTATAYECACASTDFSLVALAALARDAVVLTALRESVVLYALSVLGGPIDAPESVKIVYIWRVDPELEKRGRQFVSTFNKLFGESLPMPGAEHAKAYWHAWLGSSDLLGRCVRLGWDDTVSPVRHYHWGLVPTHTAEGIGVHEFWSTEVWTTTRFESVATRHSRLP